MFIFEANIKTIIWGCFSTQFFPLILILKSKMIQDDKQKSCFVSLDLSFHQIGHKWPLLGMFTHDILKYSYEIVVRVIFCNFKKFYVAKLSFNSSKIQVCASTVITIRQRQISLHFCSFIFMIKNILLLYSWWMITWKFSIYKILLQIYAQTCPHWPICWGEGLVWKGFH